MSFLFKGKKPEPVQPEFSTMYDPFKSSREALNTFLTSQVGKPGPAYTAPRVAPTGPLEDKSLEIGKAYGDRPATGGNFSAASDEIKKTLSGDYDPSSSPYYQAVKAEAERNLDKTNERIADTTAGGRTYFSGLRQQMEGEAARDVNIDLNKTLAALSENERARRLQAVPLALQADNYEGDAAYNQAVGLQDIGQLPRSLDQAALDAAYEQFVMANYEYPLNIAQLASGPSQQEPIFIQTGYTRRKPSLGAQTLAQLS